MKRLLLTSLLFLFVGYHPAAASPIGLGGSGFWAAEGVLNNSGGHIAWNTDGQESRDATHTAPSDAGGSQVTTSNFINVDTGTLKLQSGTNARLSLFDWDDVYALSSTSASLTDIVFTTSVLGIPLESYLSFTWAIDGTLLADLSSSNPLSPRSFDGDVINRLPIGYYASYQLSSQWVIPSSGAHDEALVAQDSISRIREGHTLDPDVTVFAQPMNIAAARPPDFAPGTRTYHDEHDIDRSGGTTAHVTVPAGMPAQVTFSLVTGYSMIASQLDFGDLDFQLAAEFQNTARLVSVQLLNADGTPFVGDWTLHSQNGYAYPVNVSPADDGPAAVPEPGTWMLVATGAAILVGRARRSSAAKRLGKA